MALAWIIFSAWVRTADFHYDLPQELIAQQPAERRDASRLLVLNRASGTREHRRFRDLPHYFNPGDLLVLNNSRVIPARLRAFKPGTNGSVEVLLIREHGVNDWRVLLKPGKRVRPGTGLMFRDRAGNETAVHAEVIEKTPEGHCRLKFAGTADLRRELEALGEIPLPPYIQRGTGFSETDAERYQTIYARDEGSVAAPTAGLHFTPEILGALRKNGIQVAEVTLHVGLGTFAPVKAEHVEEHIMHSEQFSVSEDAAQKVNAARQSGARVIAAGTTSLRVLESAASADGTLQAGAGETHLFIYPPRTFRLTDALLTNFHLPESTLLMLVSAFAAPGSTGGIPLMLETYAEAVREKYRFFSYGDAMLIL